jgi:acetyl-CoA carboxylase biotin carboxyl carrier protein
VGNDIAIDDVVGLIETMKLFNEVKADVGGRVTEITVSDGDLVEVGRPLMFVSPVSEETLP